MMRNPRIDAQKTIDQIADVTFFRLSAMAANVERFIASGANETAAEVAEEARRYAVNRWKDLEVAIRDWCDACRQEGDEHGVRTN